MKKKIDISLVNMPFYTINHPSISLGLLKAILKRDGLSSKITYGNLLISDYLFLEFFRDLLAEKFQGKENFQITGKIFFDLMSKWENKFLCDWLFAPLIFPEYKNNIDWYMKYLFNDKIFFHNLQSDRIKKMLLNLQKKAKTFLINLAVHILEDSPPVVGCSSIHCQYIPSLALLKIIKDINPETITLMGGSHFQHITSVTTHKTYSFIDYIVSGEADNIISPLVLSILEKETSLLEKELMSCVTGPEHRIKGYPEDGIMSIKESFKNLPPPDYDDYFETLKSLTHLKYMINPSLLFEASRGCWWGEKKPCAFCGFNRVGYRYRTKDVQQVIYELEYLSERYGIKKFCATDMIMDMTYFKSFLPELISHGNSYEIFCEVKSNLSHSQIKLLSEAGMKSIQPGIESLDSRILKLMNKGIKAWQNIMFLKWAMDYGIYVNWNLIYSFPGEKDCWYEEMAEIVPLLFHLQPPRTVTPVQFLRNSEYYDNSEKYGLSLRPHSFYSATFPLPEEVLRNTVFYFTEDGQIEKKEDEMYSLYYSGLISLKKEIKKWRSLFSSDKRPVLKMTLHGEKINIKDTRPCAVKPSFILEEIYSECYRLCNEALERKSVVDLLRKKAFHESRINQTIKDLVDWKLIIEVDGRLLALCVTGEYKAIPHDL